MDARSSTPTKRSALSKPLEAETCLFLVSSFIPFLPLGYRYSNQTADDKHHGRRFRYVRALLRREELKGKVVVVILDHLIRVPGRKIQAVVRAEEGAGLSGKRARIE